MSGSLPKVTLLAQQNNNSSLSTLLPRCKAMGTVGAGQEPCQGNKYTLVRTKQKRRHEGPLLSLATVSVPMPREGTAPGKEPLADGQSLHPSRD